MLKMWSEISMSIFSKLKGSISKIATKIESKLKGNFKRKNEYIIPETKTISEKKLPEIGEGVDIPEEINKTKWLKFRTADGEWYSLPYETGYKVDDLIIDAIYEWQTQLNYEFDIVLSLYDVLVVFPDKSSARLNLTEKYFNKYVLA